MLILRRPSSSARCGASQESFLISSGVACGSTNFVRPSDSSSTILVTVTSPIFHCMADGLLAGAQDCAIDRTDATEPQRAKNKLVFPAPILLRRKTLRYSVGRGKYAEGNCDAHASRDRRRGTGGVDAFASPFA